ncbi:RNA polymerase sigma factor [Candidatus Kaiserbacteria bacterium]|nr:RNA polymerase sigma factor [Candidatus Kaiserbacteria bacterium]
MDTKTPARPLTNGAFETHLISLQPVLEKFAIKFTGNPAAADDLVQDTFVKAWAHRATFESGTNMKAWLYTIMRNTHYTKMRSKTAKEIVTDINTIDLMLSGQDKCAINDGPAIIEIGRLSDALERLPQDYRDILIAYMLELSIAEMSAQFDIPEGTVKSRLFRAQTKLRKIYKADTESACTEQT